MSTTKWHASSLQLRLLASSEANFRLWQRATGDVSVLSSVFRVDLCGIYVQLREKDEKQ